MNKKFAGFTPQQEFMLLKKLGYNGGMDKKEMEKFLSASPAAAAKMGRWTTQAQEKVSNKDSKNFALGGLVDERINPETGEWRTPKEMEAYIEQKNRYIRPPKSTSTASTTTSTPKKTAVTDAYKTTGVPSGAEAVKTALDDPSSIVTPANVEKLTEQPDQIIQEGTGQAGEIEQQPTSTVDQTATATTPERTEASLMEAEKVSEGVQDITDNLEAATAEPSAKATVRGQLELLMEDFEGDGTPPWASGAMRSAMSAMQSRGLGASSMAGMAITQAAMESAIGIASQDASTQAQFEMQNLNNEQQTTIFKTQQQIAALFSDQAAENAAQQFNAVSENQTNQFFADLESTVARFNADQINATLQFNAGEENVGKRFYSQLEAQREQFNAQNDLIIAQANAQWRQTIATTNTAEQNEANRQAALQANALTQRAMDQIWQRERDLMSFAFTSSESAMDRNTQILLADKDLKAYNSKLKAEEDAANRAGLGAIAGQIIGGLF